MFTVEIYNKRNGNVLRAKSGFKSVEAAMDWGYSNTENGMGFRVFPS